MWAMWKNNPGIVSTLLAYPHTRLDCTDIGGYTGLHWACIHNSSSVIPIIGKDGRCTSDMINLRNAWGSTALIAAVERGYLDCVKEMDKLEGTNFETKNSQGETLLEVGRRKNHATVVHYLTERSSQVTEDVATNTTERMNLIEHNVKRKMKA